MVRAGQAARGAGHVVVVGGGLAGLSAALRCADAGSQVTLLEARARLGGATWSFERHGRWFDNGQHVFLRCCSAYSGFLRRIGSDAHVSMQDRLAVAVLAPGGRAQWLRRGRLGAPWHLAASVARYRHMSAGDRARVARAALALRRLDLTDPGLDATSFAEWLVAHGQRISSNGPFWDLITLPTVNLPSSEASAAMAAKVFQTALLTDAAGGDIGVPAVPLAHLHASPARLALERAGAEVRTQARVVEISASEGGLSVAMAGGERLLADAVVLATPHQEASRLLPDGAVANKAELQRLGISPIVNVTVVYDRRVTDIAIAAAVGSPVQWVLDHTAASHPDGAPGGEQVLSVSLSAADAWLGTRPEKLTATFSEALAELLPAARRARVLDAVVTRERAATFRAAPGTGALRPGPVTGVDRLVLAGAWTATGWPATMEGAVRSGEAAASALLGTTGAEAPPRESARLTA